MNENSTLDELSYYKIYDLAKHEPDEMLRDSMIHTLIRRDDLPIELLEKEVESPFGNIARKAKDSIEKRRGLRIVSTE